MDDTITLYPSKLRELREKLVDTGVCTLTWPDVDNYRKTGADMGYVIGVDPSLRASAIVVAETDTGELVYKEDDIGYSIPRGANWVLRNKRVKSIVKRLDYIINKHKCVDAIVFEGPSLGSKGAQVYYLGELSTPLVEMLRAHAPLVFEVAPNSLKKFATGKGNAKKPLIAAHVQKRWNMIFNSDDLTDAYVLCQIGRVLLGALGVPKTNFVALDKVIRYVKDR
jgi:crossover junction endodeoxyribonuclease RuvC